jgi:ABC-type antimicrobial peptide transport system permease subunit
VADVKHASLREPSAPEFYVTYSQMPWNFMTVVVRTSTPLSTVGANITAAISAVDPLLPAPPVRPMRDLISTSLAMDAFETAGLSAFAAIGLSLAVLGIYGLMSYTVSRRTAEVALRIAIGAAPRSIATLVLLDAGRIVAVGMMAGACAAVLASRVIRASLFGVAPLDPLTFAAVILIVAAVGIGAAYVPARRAMRVNPARAMAVD